MGTALFTGVTGLKVHQQKLDVVANNIANVNTVGYRGSRILFQDLFSQTLRGGSASVDNFGGSNPQQVGLGVQVASIDTDFTQGSLQTTGVSSDLAIQGNGFFVLSNGTLNAYTRDGSFSLNANGLLIEPGTGMFVQGYMADDSGTIDTNTSPTNIEIPIGGASIVRATTTASLIGNLNADEEVLGAGEYNVERSFTVYDSLGTPRDIKVVYRKEAAPPNNTWTWDAFYNNGTTEVSVASSPEALTFDTDGTLPADTTGTIEIDAADLGDPDSQPETFIFTVDFSAITQLSVDDSEASDVTLQNQDGFARGVLQSFNIGDNGQINGVFSNGLTRVIAQVALGTFSNVGGLMRDGDNMFLETPSSGAAQLGPPETGGRGSVSGGVLESANVDLGTEFSELIITQRGYQANARTITAADTLLQETVNLVR